MISKIQKIKFKNKIIELFIFRYFNIRNFEISKYQSFYVSSLQILTATQKIILKCIINSKFFFFSTYA